jgi:hypothetical protein
LNAIQALYQLSYTPKRSFGLKKCVVNQIFR